MWLEALKLLVLLGVAVKSVAARFWIGVVAAVAMIYVGVGIVAVVLFEKRFPPITELVQRHGLAIVSGLLAVPVTMALVARAGSKTRPGWKEVGDLFGLVAIVQAAQIALALALR